MRRTLLLLTFILSTLVPTASEVTPEEILPAGMLLQCSLDEPNFSSLTAQIGDPVLCHLGAVAAFGRSVFPRSAYLGGRFQEYRDPGRLLGKGSMELAFDRLILPGAVSVPLSAKVISVPRFRVNQEGKIQGRGHPKRDAVGWAIPILWPVKILSLPGRGPRPALKGEVHITLRLLEDVEIPATVSAPRTTSSVLQTPGFKPTNRSEPLHQSLHGESSELSAAGATVTRVPTLQLPETLKSGYFSAGLSAPQFTWLALKDGTSYLVSDYWVQFGKLLFVTLEGERKLFPLERLDLDETIRINQERNVAFVIRGQER